MIRLECKSTDTVPAHLMPTVGAALAARLRVSLWTVRELTVVHVTDGSDWRLFMPEVRDSDALELYTRIAQRMTSRMEMNGDRVKCAFLFSSAQASGCNYHGDMGAALRGVITTAAYK